MDWVTLLTPIDGERMAPAMIEDTVVLTGRTSEFSSVAFLTGGPQAISSPYPALRHEFDLAVNDTLCTIFCLSTMSNPEAAFSEARRIAAKNWEAELARIQLTNDAQLEIHTGNPEWDAVIAFSQKTAYSLFLGPTSHLPEASFVLTRHIDQGYSLKGDGSDYSHLWNGQSPLEAYYLSEILLPGSAELLIGILRNYLASQHNDGSIDWKPGLAGQRSRLLASPILSTLAWRIYQYTQDILFLEEIFPQLIDFFHVWFTEDHDRDGDGIPEWDHPMQAGFEDHPLFSRWHSWSSGVDICSVESPALCSLLLRECDSLIKIAQLTNRLEPVPALQSLADNLATALETAWDDEQATFHYWDRDTHERPAGEVLGERQGPGLILISKTFEKPIRLLIHIVSPGETTQHPNIFIHGENIAGQNRVERIEEESYKWFMGRGFVTGSRVYTALEKIDISGISEDDNIIVTSVDLSFQDHTNLLPLWGGSLSEERAKRFIKNSIMNPEIYCREFGLIACPEKQSEASKEICSQTYLPISVLICRSLLTYGYRTEAAELISRIMNAILQNLKEKKTFNQYYHADTGKGTGERNALSGLAPISLFLEALGMRVITPTRIYLEGENPFPWPVSVKYHGLSVLRQKERTVITFPTGETYQVEDPSPQLITLE